MKKKQETYRITRYNGYLKQYYVERRHSILWGLIAWWHPANDLPRGCWFKHAADAAGAVYNKYPDAMIEWHE